MRSAILKWWLSCGHSFSCWSISRFCTKDWHHLTLSSNIDRRFTVLRQVNQFYFALCYHYAKLTGLQPHGKEHWLHSYNCCCLYFIGRWHGCFHRLLLNRQNDPCQQLVQQQPSCNENRQAVDRDCQEVEKHQDTRTTYVHTRTALSSKPTTPKTNSGATGMERHGKATNWVRTCRQKKKKPRRIDMMMHPSLTQINLFLLRLTRNNARQKATTTRSPKASIDTNTWFSVWAINLARSKGTTTTPNACLLVTKNTG